MRHEPFWATFALTVFLVLAAYFTATGDTLAGAITIGHGHPDCTNVAPAASLQGCNGIPRDAALSVTYGDSDTPAATVDQGEGGGDTGDNGDDGDDDDPDDHGDEGGSGPGKGHGKGGSKAS